MGKAVRLRYGADAELDIEWPDTMKLVDWSKPVGEPLADPAAVIGEALAEPLGHPPLGECVVVGDQITIALEPGLPQSAAIASGITRYLVEAGHSPDSVTVLWRPAHVKDEGPVADFDPTHRDAVHFVRHDPDEAPGTAYLAATKTAEPIYLNRALSDADFVLPVGLLRSVEAFGYGGMFGGFFPTFSQREAQQRLRPAVGPSHAARQKRLAAIADEVAWLLGIHFSVQAIPGPGDSLLEIVAGNAAALRVEGMRRCEAAWHHPRSQSADLVVVAIGGGPSQQTWENIGRALFTATRAVNDQGAIVLATEIATRPGSALRRFGRWSEEDPEPKSRKHEVEPDLVPAQLLLAARQRARVYLLSKLKGSVAEMIGAIHIDEPDEIVRLGRKFDSCLVLGDAQYATLSLDALEPTS